MSDTTALDRTALGVALQAQADRLMPCVHCGFCLPACPTYVRLGDENDSPRGRLHLMRAVVEGRLSPASDAFQTHIDRCLGCRACEPVCPSGVEYGLLLESAREAALRARRPPASVRLLLAVFARPSRVRYCMALARAMRSMGLARLLSRLLPKGALFHTARFGLAMLAASRASRFPRPRSRAASAGEGEPSGGNPPDWTVEATDLAAETAVAKAGGRVALLTGCVQAGLFERVNEATGRVLEANGYEMVSAPGQRCCGALHSHAGDLRGARELARANVRAFEAAGMDFIVVNAAGCGAALKEYGHLLVDDADYAERAARLAEAARDASELLALRGPRTGASLPLRATYDAACHLCHAQGVHEEPRALLDAIPDLEVVPLRGEEECCGGAGIYGITHPELGGRIGADKVSAVVETEASVVATANPGCMMQIGAGLLLEGSRIDVKHPVELLDESYRRAGFYA